MNVQGPCLDKAEYVWVHLLIKAPVSLPKNTLQYFICILEVSGKKDISSVLTCVVLLNICTTFLHIKLFVVLRHANFGFVEQCFRPVVRIKYSNNQ